MKVPGWRIMGWKVGNVEDVGVRFCEVEAMEFGS